MVETWSLYLTWAWIGTGSRQTDRIAIADTRSAVPASTAVVHKNLDKSYKVDSTNEKMQNTEHATDWYVLLLQFSCREEAATNTTVSY